jgi:type I restriction enzyme M protein
LAGLLKNNIDFNAVKGKTKMPDQKWKDLLDHLNQPRFELVIVSWTSRRTTSAGV